MFKNLKIVFVLIAILAIAVSSYAFADANIVPDTKAGEGSGDVAGYTVTDVVYNLDTLDPSKLDSVGFDLGAAALAGQVKVQLVGSGTWYGCTLDTGTVWECATGDILVSTIDQLRVVAASN